MACACYSSEYEKRAREQNGFTLNKATYKQLIGYLNIQLTVKNNPNMHMSWELLNIDNKYLAFFLLQLAMSAAITYHVIRFYRQFRSCESPLLFLLIASILDLMANWVLWMHYDWYTGNGIGLNFLFVLGNMGEQLSHFLLLIVFGCLALGWMVTSANFPDNEPYLVTAIGITLISVVIGGLNVITVDSEGNFQAYGPVQSIFLVLFSISFLCQFLFEFHSLKARAPLKLQISIN